MTPIKMLHSHLHWCSLLFSKGSVTWQIFDNKSKEISQCFCKSYSLHNSQVTVFCQSRKSDFFQTFLTFSINSIIMFNWYLVQRLNNLMMLCIAPSVRATTKWAIFEWITPTHFFSRSGSGDFTQFLVGVRSEERTHFLVSGKYSNRWL